MDMRKPPFACVCDCVYFWGRKWRETFQNPPRMIPIVSEVSRKSERSHHELAYLLHSSLFIYHSCINGSDTGWSPKFDFGLGLLVQVFPFKYCINTFWAQVESKSMRPASFFGVSFWGHQIFYCNWGRDDGWYYRTNREDFCIKISAIITKYLLIIFQNTTISIPCMAPISTWRAPARWVRFLWMYSYLHFAISP